MPGSDVQTVVMMSRSEADPIDDERITRFSRASRAAHWLNAIGFFVLVSTGAVMWGAPGTQWVGYRQVVRNVHFIAGLLVLVPLVVGWLASRDVRDDVRRLARWSLDDRRWWFRSQRRRVRLGKFNPGQKANAAFTFAALLTLLGTGFMLKWPDPFGDDLRAGATAVHDWTSYALGLVVIGHIFMALRDRESLRGMAQGTVSDSWARTERPRWHAETRASAAATSQTQNDPEVVEIGR